MVRELRTRPECKTGMRRVSRSHKSYWIASEATSVFGPRTEEAYVGWIRRFVIFHRKRHPRELGDAEVRQFLTDLAEKQNVSASTQNQALNALIFLYRQVLQSPLGKMEAFVRFGRNVRKTFRSS